MRWIFRKLTAIYHFFGPILIGCFAIACLAMIIFTVLSMIPSPVCSGLILPQSSGQPIPPTPWYKSIHISEILGAIMTYTFLLAIGMSILYIILGIVRYFLKHSNKIKTKGLSVKELLLRGISGIAVAILLFFTLSLALDVIPLCL